LHCGFDNCINCDTGNVEAATLSPTIAVAAPDPAIVGVSVGGTIFGVLGFGLAYFIQRRKPATKAMNFGSIVVPPTAGMNAVITDV
jgi:hypothetical protein